MKILWVIGAGLALSGCATIASGSDQEIAISSVPEGATCEIWREGFALVRDIRTPQQVTIDRDIAPIEVVCVLDGHQETRLTAEADMEAATAGNLLLGGIVGLAIDAASGAGNSYPNEITVELTPIPFQPRGTFDGRPSTPLDEPAPGV